MEFTQIKSVVEALLFASDVPISLNRLRTLIGADSATVQRAIHRLNEEYEETDRAFVISEVAGGFQMTTRTEYGPWVKRLFRGRTETKLSSAALETLAIIAYKQPIMRADIEAIRGVNVGGVLATLLERRLIQIKGRAEAVGRPLLYGTSKRFLQYFGLKTLDDLPKPGEIQELLEQRERESAYQTEPVSGTSGDRVPSEV